MELGGLAPLFALFMGRSKVKGPKGDKAGGDVAREVEERAVSMVSSLLQVGGGAGAKLLVVVVGP